MDKKEQEIRANLKRIASEHAPDFLFDGIVVEVDAENYLVDVELDTGGVIYECRLRAIATGNKSIDILPKEGSAVVIAKISDDDYLVLTCDEIDDIRLSAAGYEIQANANGIAIRKGGESLNKILSDLVDEILKIYAPMNKPGLGAIKQRVGNLLAN